MKQILHYGAVLLVFSGLAGVGLHGVNALTKDKIAASQRRALTDGQRLVFPAAARFSEERAFTAGGKQARYYEAYDESGACIGYELLHTVQGYQSPITVLTAITLDGTIAGIKVLGQAETPGLGAEIEALPTSKTLWQALGGLFGAAPAAEEAAPAVPAFQAQFAGKRAEQLRVVKQAEPGAIEAIAGATITSDAVAKAVREAITDFLAAQAAQPHTGSGQ